ncbi:MAG TPA: GAF domain-containing protein, partial [Aggregatilineales bacterium]|nr:GAF domain-containing protein [Aggregatilineales bacterium]
RAVQTNLPGHLQILATSMAVIGIVSIGQTLVVLTGGIDLSVGSLMALTGVIAAYLTTYGLGSWLPSFNPWIAAGIALLLATFIGYVHGFLIARFQLAPFIVTFASLSLLRGLAQVISNGSPINLQSDTLGWLWNNVLGIIPFPALVMAGLFIAVAYMLRNTRLGRYTYAIGSNPTVARLSGVNVSRTQKMIYAASGFLAGVAGLLLIAWISGGAFNSGENYELLSIAAVIIGGTSLKGGTGGVWGTLAGVLLMALVSNGLVLLSIPPIWKEAITGAIIMAAALIDMQRRRLQESASVTPRSFVPPPIEPSMRLDETLDQLAKTIQERFSYDEIRIYLYDRETGALIEPASSAKPGGTLAAKAIASGEITLINDLNRDMDMPTIPWRTGNRSAAAIPIQHGKRPIGAIEIQSGVPNAFSPQDLEVASMLAGYLAADIEDRWLLESGWLRQQVRECLKNLTDDGYLNRCALADWLQMTGMPNRSLVLRQLLVEAIDRTLVAKNNLGIGSRANRRYQILKQTYVEQIPADVISQNLSLSRRQYFYDLKEAVDGVVDYVIARRGQFDTAYHVVASVGRRVAELVPAEHVGNR